MKQPSSFAHSALAKSRLYWKLFRGGGIVSLLVVLFSLTAVSSVFSIPVIVSTKTDTLTVDSDADNFADPGDTIRYTNFVTNTGSTDAGAVVFNDTIDSNTTLVAGSLRTTPIARNDNFTSLGNVGITVPAGSGVLANDDDPDGTTPTLSVVAAAGGTASGGAFSIVADGSFSYLPPAGFEGADSFTYNVQDSDGNQDPATVFIAVNEVIWFIDNSQSSAGSGVLGDPFNSLSGFNSSAADEAGDIIFIYSGSGSYGGGTSLLNNQFLIGQGASASIAAVTGITVPPHSNALPGTGGTRPTITTGSGDGVVVGQNNTLRGFNVGNTAGAGISDNGGTVGTLTVSEVALTGSGEGFEADNGGTLAVTLDSLNANSGAHGLSLANTGGSFSVTGTGGANSGGTLSGHSAEGVFLNNATNISLTDMVINQSATSSTQGIDATSVTGLTLVRTTITAGSGNSYAMLGSTIRNWTATSSVFDGGGGSVPNIDGTRVTNLLGTNTLTNSTFRNGKNINLLIENNTNGGGLDTITISGSSFSNSAGGDHLQVEADGTANLKLVVNASSAGNTTFSGTGQDGMQLEAEGNATFQAVVTQATISGNLGSAVNLAAVVNGHMIARVHGLTGLTSGGTNVINMINFDNSLIEATIENNTINLGGTAFNGMRVIQEGNGTITTRIANNSITGVANERGILVQGRAGTGGNGTLNATINNNTVNVSGTNSLDGIEVTSGSSAGGDTNTICLNMFSNNSTSENFDGYFLRHRTGSTFQLQDFTGSANTTDITNWVNNVKSNTGSVFVSDAAGFTAAPAPCATPTVPTASIPAGATVVDVVDDAPQMALQLAPVELSAAPAVAPETAVAARTKAFATSKRAELPALSGETVNVPLGTLDPGQVVTITFDVTIDSPQSPANNGQVCNQGTISGNNFVNVFTDDPDVGGSADPTCTTLAPGTIVIAKDQSPDGSSSFGFTSNIPGNAAFNVSGDSSTTIHNVVAGSYTVTEDDPAAAFFQLTGLTCDDGGSAAPSTTDLGTRTATVNLESGETVTCTFTNTPANEPPVANNDSYSTNEDTTLNEATAGPLGSGVLANDTDADGDSLTAVKDSDPSHGTLTLNSDGSFSYEPDANYCGPDSFTYHANDGQADSNVATVDIDVTCVDDPPTVSVDVTTQSVQYSDSISTVTVTASDVDSHPLSISDDAPSNLATSGNCTSDGMGGTSCTWTLDGQVLVSAATYDVTFTVSDATSDVTASTEIVVTPEDADVSFDSDNPVAVEVSSPGGSGSFTLVVYVQESSESGAGVLPGDINEAVVSVTLEPIGPGSPLTVSCTSTGPVAAFNYSAVLEVTCNFSSVPVNAYVATATVTGGFYTGTAEDAIAIYDPSLGFTTGGGSFFWPGTNDRTTFGYTMSYNKNGKNLKGNLVLIRHVEGSDEIYRLKSNALDSLALGEGDDNGETFGWAVFSGKATYQAPGMAEPEGNYTFTVYVEDRGEPGKDNDRFWLEVRDRDGNVVSDLSLSPEAAENAVTLSGGNIVVPHSNSGGGGGKK
ncbi:MAG TPA: Ig-like domain-containing protein [Anaerolineae bacterium]